MTVTVVQRQIMNLVMRYSTSCMRYISGAFVFVFSEGTHFFCYCLNSNVVGKTILIILLSIQIP